MMKLLVCCSKRQKSIVLTVMDLENNVYVFWTVQLSEKIWSENGVEIGVSQAHSDSRFVAPRDDFLSDFRSVFNQWYDSNNFCAKVKFSFENNAKRQLNSY
jgi:hypothetical protein